MTEDGFPIFYAVPLLVFLPIFFLVLRAFGLFRIIGELVARKPVAQAASEPAPTTRRRAPPPRGVRPDEPGLQPLRLAGQALAYVPFLVVVGAFAAWPTYEYVPADHARLKVSIGYTGQRKEECRQRSREELAKLAPNMRAPQSCSRERWPLQLQLRLDGEPLIDVERPPAGLSADMPSSFYRVIDVPAGAHHIAVRLKDRGDAEVFPYSDERTVTLVPGQSLVIGFDQRAGGFQYR